MSRVGARVREVRVERGMTLTYVADLLDIGQSTLSKYETGKLKLDADMLPALGEVMGVDPCLFLNRQAIPVVSAAAIPSREDPLTPGAQSLLDKLVAEGLLTEIAALGPDAVETFSTVVDFIKYQRMRDQRMQTQQWEKLQRAGGDVKRDTPEQA